jgi:hypothetical protein
MLALNYCLNHMLWSKSFVNFMYHVLELLSFRGICYHVRGSKRHLIFRACHMFESYIRVNVKFCVNFVNIFELYSYAQFGCFFLSILW